MLRGSPKHTPSLGKHARHYIISKETLRVVDNEWFQVIFGATQSLLVYLEHVQFRGGVYLCIWSLASLMFGQYYNANWENRVCADEGTGSWSMPEWHL